MSYIWQSVWTEGGLTNGKIIIHIYITLKFPFLKKNIVHTHVSA